MTPKTIKCVDQEKQDTFSCKHENTLKSGLKSMEFSEGDKQLFLAHQIEKSYVLPHVRNSFLTYLYHKDRKIPVF